MTRILSLDDEPEMLKLISLIFQLAGYEHVYTTDSHDALSMLRSQSIDLFTQDVMRPDIDGLELYQIMKSDANLRHIPVLFISAGPREEFAAECRSAYGDDYLTKPFWPRALLAVSMAVLQRHGKHVPTEEERTVRHAQIRAKLRDEMNWSDEQLDALYKRISDFPKEASSG